jgi:hypothetical protein
MEGAVVLFEPSLACRVCSHGDAPDNEEDEAAYIEKP